MPENDEIKALSDRGVKKYLFSKLLEFLKNHGISVNTFLLIIILLSIVWYGRPLYDKFNMIPMKIESNDAKDRSQDSIIKVNDEKEKKQNMLLNKQFEKIAQNFMTLIDYRNSDKALSKRAIENNRPILLRISQDSLSIKRDTTN